MSFEPKLKGKKIAMFVEFNYEDLEIHYPLIRLREEEAIVDLIAPKSDFQYKGKHGSSNSHFKPLQQVTHANQKKTLTL
jgi:putative intracellular protease/amidase